MAPKAFLNENQFLTNQCFYFRGGYLPRLGGDAGSVRKWLIRWTCTMNWLRQIAPALPTDGVIGLAMGLRRSYSHWRQPGHCGSVVARSRNSPHQAGC